MHAFILMVIAFIAPINGQPESIRVAPAVTPSLAACQALGEATSSEVSQMKGVEAVKYGCIEVSNPADKVT